MRFLSKFFVAVILAISLVFVWADPSLAEISRSNWSMTCYDASISNGTLSATCKRADGSPNPTSIDTDKFIGNIDGKLMSSETSGLISRKDWSMTCSYADINGGTLSAECRNINGAVKPTSIDTDKFIGNINGTLMTNL